MDGWTSSENCFFYRRTLRPLSIPARGMDNSHASIAAMRPPCLSITMRCIGGAIGLALDCTIHRESVAPQAA